MSKVVDHINASQEQALDELFELLRIPSISTQDDHAGYVTEAADWLCKKFTAMGLQAETIPTEKHPLVFAQGKLVPNKPTVLIYGHYDVQPPDPLEEWVTPPFEPTLRNGFIFARGASDDKGQLMCHLQAIRAFQTTMGGLPLNVKVIMEGEEESVGRSLIKFIQNNAPRLAADYVLVSDGAQHGPGQPAITDGLRGIVYIEVILRGPNRDLHSGAYGGGLVNPANALAKLIAGLHDTDGRVTLDGFYDRVNPLDPLQRQAWAQLGSDDDKLKKQWGIDALTGEKNYTTRERIWARPTLDVNGLLAGYIAPGAKTIIPARASAKISMRLVDQQDPQDVAKSFKKYFTDNISPGLKVDFIDHGQAGPVQIDRSGPGLQAAKRALQKAFSAEPVFVRSGGSIPVVSILADKITPQVLLLGFALPDDNAHSPNENFRVQDYHHGQLASAYLLADLAGLDI